MHISKVTAGSAAVVLVAAGVVAFGGSSAQSGGQQNIVGIFSDAGPLEVGNEVRTAGVKVGTIKSIKLDGKDARVTMSVDKNVLPLHNDARLLVSPINVLGENYVSIDPGKDSAGFLSGNTVPLDHTSSSVTLQDVLNTLNDPTSTALAALVTTMGEGTRNGGGQNVADAIKALAPLMGNLDQLGTILRNQNAVLDQLISKADPVAASLATDNGHQLNTLVTNAQQTLGALADEQAALESTIEQLPSTLSEAQTTLGSLDTVAKTVAPTLQSARPVTHDLNAIAQEINRFSPYANPAFNGFDALFRQADALLREARPVAQQLNVSGPSLRATAANLRPVGDSLLNQHLGDLMSFVTKWALSTNSRDALSHYFRGVVHVTPAALNSLIGANLLPNVGSLNNQGSLPGSGGANNPLSGLSGTVSGLTNSLSGTVSGLTGTLGNTLGGLLGSPSSSASPHSSSGGGLLGGLLGGTPRRQADSATGLTAQQEQNLLTQLTGGQ